MASAYPSSTASSPASAAQGRDVFSGGDGELQVRATRHGVVFSKAFTERSYRHKVLLGSPAAPLRFVACHRVDPFWMRPKCGQHCAELPVDTQYALFDLGAESYLLLVPLPTEPYHASLQGDARGVWVVLDSGDPGLSAPSAQMLYAAFGADVYALLQHAAQDLSAELGVGHLREQKPLPTWVDVLGWCTWDAFYREVSAQGVLEGLRSFRAGGVQPGCVILDDGWQSVSHASDQGRLCSLQPNAKFSHDLSTTVQTAKSEFGVRSVVAWHAVHGYWAGLDADALPDYDVQARLRYYSPEVLRHAPGMNAEGGPVAYCPSAAGLVRFYNEYHAALAQQGIDGVKVDNQASIEGLALGAGGRVRVARELRAALEHSVSRHFAGNLLNCMSGASELFYFAKASNLARTSTDFWPDHPASHGAHVYTNALVSLWFGHFMHPDWDMFQSGHAAGLYHAAARAISGSPVYVSDKPGSQDFALLQRLVLADGSVPRPLDFARPTLDCLFVDVTAHATLLKLFNTNAFSDVLGLFNARHSPAAQRVDGTFSPADVPRVRRAAGGEFALYRVLAGKLERSRWDGQHRIQLGNLECEIVVVTPLEDDCAVIGLTNQLNPGGTLYTVQRPMAGVLKVQLRAGGPVLFYARRAPAHVLVNGRDVTAQVRYLAASGALTVHAAEQAPYTVEVHMPQTPARDP